LSAACWPAVFSFVRKNAFAAELLIPQEQLKKHQAELKNPEKLAGVFQVSRPAMVIAIANFFSSGRKLN
jgi:Zn-dependent peptidase ImmA (M78 family)